MNGARIIFEASVVDVLSLMGAVAVACLFARRRRFQPIGWLVLYIIFENIVALLPIIFHWNFGQWNWIGQLASFILSLIVAMRFFRKEEVGLQLPRTRSEILWTIGGIFVALSIAIGPALTGNGTHPSAETFAYQAILPGPVEELAFRGIGLALLMRAFSTGDRDRRAEWIAVFVTAVWFTAGHVFHLDNGQFHIFWSRIRDVFPMAVMYSVVRLRSRSLLGGVLAHNAANTLVEFVASVRF